MTEHEGLYGEMSALADVLRRMHPRALAMHLAFVLLRVRPDGRTEAIEALRNDSKRYRAADRHVRLVRKLERAIELTKKRRLTRAEARELERLDAQLEPLRRKACE